MNEVQRNYILATQGESLKQRHDLDEILDICDIEESTPQMVTSDPFDSTSTRMIYGTKNDKLIRLRKRQAPPEATSPAELTALKTIYGTKIEELIESCENQSEFFREEIKRHPYFQVAETVAGLAFGAALGYGVFYGMGELGILMDKYLHVREEVIQAYGTAAEQARNLRYVGAISSILTLALVGLKEIPPTISQVCYESKIWKKFKERKSS